MYVFYCPECRQALRFERKLPSQWQQWLHCPRVECQTTLIGLGVMPRLRLPDVRVGRPRGVLTTLAPASPPRRAPRTALRTLTRCSPAERKKLLVHHREGSCLPVLDTLLDWLEPTPPKGRRVEDHFARNYCRVVAQGLLCGGASQRIEVHPTDAPSWARDLTETWERLLLDEPSRHLEARWVAAEGSVPLGIRNLPGFREDIEYRQYYVLSDPGQRSRKLKPGRTPGSERIVIGAPDQILYSPDANSSASRSERGTNVLRSNHWFLFSFSKRDWLPWSSDRAALRRSSGR